MSKDKECFICRFGVFKWQETVGKCLCPPVQTITREMERLPEIVDCNITMTIYANTIAKDCRHFEQKK